MKRSGFNTFLDVMYWAILAFCVIWCIALISAVFTHAEAASIDYRPFVTQDVSTPMQRDKKLHAGLSAFGVLAGSHMMVDTFGVKNKTKAIFYSAVAMFTLGVVKETFIDPMAEQGDLKANILGIALGAGLATVTLRF